MKRWMLSVVISLIPIVCVLFYYYRVIKQAVCLESGGLWLGFFQGCDLTFDEGYYSLSVSPVSAVILVAIWAVLVWVVSLVFKRLSV